MLLQQGSVDQVNVCGMSSAMFGGHIFDRVCKEHGILYTLTQSYHRGPMAKPNA